MFAAYFAVLGLRLVVLAVLAEHFVVHIHSLVQIVIAAE